MPPTSRHRPDSRTYRKLFVKTNDAITFNLLRLSRYDKSAMTMRSVDKVAI